MKTAAPARGRVAAAARISATSMSSSNVSTSKSPRRAAPWRALLRSRPPWRRYGWRPRRARRCCGPDAAERSASHSRRRAPPSFQEALRLPELFDNQGDDVRACGSSIRYSQEILKARDGFVPAGNRKCHVEAPVAQADAQHGRRSRRSVRPAPRTAWTRLSGRADDEREGRSVAGHSTIPHAVRPSTAIPLPARDFAEPLLIGAARPRRFRRNPPKRRSPRHVPPRAASV